MTIVWRWGCALVLMAMVAGIHANRLLAQQGAAASAAHDSTHHVGKADSVATHDSTVAHDSSAAHDSTARARKHPARPVVHDTISGPPVTPVRAMLYSFAVPGLGQAKLGRAYTGAFFFGIEAICYEQLRQAIVDKHYASHHSPDSIPATYETDPTTGLAILDSLGNPEVATYAYNRYAGGRLGARSLHVEDWVAALIFNHLISGADAFVSAQLWDLPGHVRPPVRLQIYPDLSQRGRMVYALSFPAPRFTQWHW